MSAVPSHDDAPRDDASPPVRPRSKPRVPKWVFLAAFWVTQAVVLWLVQATLYSMTLYVSSESVWFFKSPQEPVRPPDDGLPVVVSPESHWVLSDVGELLFDSEYLTGIGIGVLVLTVAQALFLLPVRQPGMAGKRGKGVRTSLVVAGLVIGVLCIAVCMALVEFDQTVTETGVGEVAANTLETAIPGPYWMSGVVPLVFGWAVATPLLIAFSGRGRRETVLARLANRLLIGTMVEVALLIPLDVMVRRSGSCYCLAGTYWGLTLCGFVGVFALGPAVFLPLLAKRRKRWYDGHCAVCRYDMTAMMDAARCPECGTGWRV